MTEKTIEKEKKEIKKLNDKEITKSIIDNIIKEHKDVLDALGED